MTFIEHEHPRVHGRFTDKEQTASEVDLAVNPYWDSVADLRNPDTDAATLLAAASAESEDDFMIVIAGHGNATAEAIEIASQHHSFAVRRAAIGNPNTSDATLARLAVEGHATAEKARTDIVANGRNPMTNHDEWLATEAALIASGAEQALEERRASGDLATVTSLDDFRVRSALGRATNMMGQPIGDAKLQGILDYLDDPTEDRWEEIKGTMITPSSTLWQETLRHTDYDVTTGTVTRIVDEGFPPFRPAATERVSGFTSIPKAEQISAAVIAAADATDD